MPALPPDLCQQVWASHAQRKPSSLRASLKSEETLPEVLSYLTVCPHKSLVPAGFALIPKPILSMLEVPCADQLRTWVEEME